MTTQPATEGHRPISPPASTTPDGAAETAFDDLTCLAATITGTPISLVSLMEGDRIVFKSGFGWTPGSSPRGGSFCAFAMESGHELIVEYAPADPRFGGLPIVTGAPGVRFYAGVPLIMDDGTRPGVLCIMDTSPRRITPEQLQSLRMLARQVSAQLSLRLAIARVNAERENLRLTEERYDAAVRASGMVMYDWSPQVDRVVFSSNLTDVLGYSPEELGTLDAFIAIVHPDDRKAFTDEIERCNASRSSFQLEYRLRRKNGDYLTVNDRGHFAHVAVGDPDRVVGFIADISETRRLQRLLQIAIDAMPQRVFWKDRNSVYLGCNLAFARDAGRTTPADIVGQTDFDQPWRERAAQYRADDAGVMNSGVERLNFEEPYTAAGGVHSWARTSKIPLRDEAGNVVGVMATFEDITLERPNQEALRKARDDAESANRAKSEFLANMSHEIRTPMTAILGYSELLRDLVDSTPETRLELIDTVRHKGEHLMNIINDILDLSKIEAGKMTIESANVNPAEVARQVLETIKPRAEAKSLSLSLDIDAELPQSVRTDATRLRQILVNLVGNAVKFTEHGGITVHLSFNTDSGNSYLVARVTDTGIGMTPEQLGALFVPFSQPTLQ